jgi:hypothetical protein
LPGGQTAALTRATVDIVEPIAINEHAPTVARLARRQATQPVIQCRETNGDIVEVYDERLDVFVDQDVGIGNRAYEQLSTPAPERLVEPFLEIGHRSPLEMPD